MLAKGDYYGFGAVGDSELLDDDERVPVDEPHGVGLDHVADLLMKSLGLDVAAQAVFDIAVLGFQGDVRKDRVACRLYPVDHVVDDLARRL